MAKITLFPHERNDDPILVLAGELGKKDIDELNRAFDELQTLLFKTLYLDLSKLRSILSMGLGALFYQYFQLRKQGREIILLNPSSEIEFLLRLSGLDNLMSIYKD